LGGGSLRENVADVSFLPKNERNEAGLIVSSWFNGLGWLGSSACFLIRVAFVKFSLFVDLWLCRWLVEGNGIVSI